LSKSLSDLYTIREATLSAIRDLKRSRNQVADNHAAEIAVLQAGLGQVNRDIERQHNFLSAPKINEEEGTTRSFLCRRPQESAAEYHFLVDKPVTENRIEYLGFRCPKCDASVARWKQIVPWGQGSLRGLRVSLCDLRRAYPRRPWLDCAGQRRALGGLLSAIRIALCRMKINRYELAPNPSPQDLETLSLLQVAQRDREIRLASLAKGMAKATSAIWNDLRGILTVNSVAPTLPPVPLLSFFYGDESTHSIYFCGGTSFQRYPIAAPQKIGVALSQGDTWLLRLDLEEENRLSMSVTGGYHQRTLDLVSSTIFGRQKEAVRSLAEEFFLLANVDDLVTRYSNALTSVGR
jgi:hypothetical protein